MTSGNKKMEPGKKTDKRRSRKDRRRSPERRQTDRRANDARAPNLTEEEISALLRNEND